MLYPEMMTSYSKRTALTATPTISSKQLISDTIENASDLPSQPGGLNAEQMSYKRDTRSKLVLIYSSKKYAIVLDWKYSLPQYFELGGPLSKAVTI
jgi:hypothetical protein